MANTPTPDPLSQLKDIHLPEAAGWWPLAWGWWLLFAIIFMVMAFLCYRWLRHVRRNRYRRLAAREAAALYQQYQQDNNAQSYLRQVNQLLRRTALAAYPRSSVARLSGQAWLSWLDSRMLTPLFMGSPGEVLLSGPYQISADIDPKYIHQLATQWIKKHS